MTSFLTIFKRELLINYKKLSNFIINTFFFFLGILIFIFSLGPDSVLITNFSSSIIWTIILFCIILGVDQFFSDDYHDGSLKELLSIGYSTEIIVLSKILVMWIYLIFPILLTSPILLVIMQIGYLDYFILILSIALGTPSLLMISSSAVLLTMQSNQNKLILLLLVFPFYIPTLIFGVSNSSSLLDSDNFFMNFFILIAIFLITLPITLISNKLAIEELNR